jgi:hypothetical protein
MTNVERSGCVALDRVHMLSVQKVRSEGGPRVVPALFHLLSNFTTFSLALQIYDKLDSGRCDQEACSTCRNGPVDD